MMVLVVLLCIGEANIEGSVIGLGLSYVGQWLTLHRLF
jgi:hypothetical protein